MGLHQRYARWLGDAPRPMLYGRADRDEATRRRLSSLFDSMMRALYDASGATFSVDILASPQAREFIDAHAGVLDSSFTETRMSEAMRRRLTRSDYIFSGMKTFHELHEAFPSLVDADGSRKPFDRFLREVRAIDRTYNRDWLRAEFNFVHASADMAARWEEFAADGDRYLLQYRTASDSRVRPEHAALHGVTLPPSDPFWAEFYPPNGWNCRCTVVQVLRGRYPETDHDEAVTRGNEALQRDSKGIFRFNPGLEQKTVPDYNPYTISRCRDCDIAKGKRSLARNLVPDNELCEACALIRAMKVEETSRKLTKEERTDIRIAAETWADRHLPKIKMTDGSKGSRLSVTLKNGDVIHIGKKFFTETFAKTIYSRRLAETMELATRVNEWIEPSIYKGNEAGRHHAFDFRVYEAEYNGQKIEFKAKVTDGFILYNMRLIK